MGYTTEYIREKYNLTQKDIANYWDIPLRTVQDWDYRSTMPRYVCNLILDVLGTMQCNYQYGDIRHSEEEAIAHTSEIIKGDTPWKPTPISSK